MHNGIFILLGVVVSLMGVATVVLLVHFYIHRMHAVMEIASGSNLKEIHRKWGFSKIPRVLSHLS